MWPFGDCHNFIDGSMCMYVRVCTCVYVCVRVFEYSACHVA